MDTVTLWLLDGLIYQMLLDPSNMNVVDYLLSEKYASLNVSLVESLQIA